jgi:hypothetical protein
MLAPQAVEFVAGSSDDLLIDLFTGEGDDAIPIPDLGGYTARCQVRYDPDHPDVLAEWSTSGPNLILLDDSIARLKVSPAMAAASLLWSWTLARFDLLLTSPAAAGGVPNRPIRGIIRVVRPITR